MAAALLVSAICTAITMSFDELYGDTSKASTYYRGITVRLFCMEPNRAV